MDDLALLQRALARPAGESSDFDLNPGLHLPPHRELRPAAVLVAVVAGQGMLLTKRSSHLKHHPGQIAFPGGKMEDTDDTPEATALREAQEEVGLPPDSVQILGRLPQHETVTGFVVTPILAHVLRPFGPVPEAGEVDEVFTVPLNHLFEPRRYAVESRRWQGQMRHYYVVPYGPHYIWGATARILYGLATRAAP